MTKIEEVWKPVVGWEGLYEISNLGRLKVLPHGNIEQEHFASVKNSKGWYLTIILHNGKRHKTKRIHRMVWEAFYGKLPEGYDVHHIDGNKQNNVLENLEAMPEHKHHTIHCHNPQYYKAMNYYNQHVKTRKIIQKSLNGEVIAIYDNGKEASNATGVCQRNILQVANKTQFSPNHYRKQAGGFKWEFVDG